MKLAQRGIDVRGMTADKMRHTLARLLISNDNTEGRRFAAKGIFVFPKVSL